MWTGVIVYRNYRRCRSRCRRRRDTVNRRRSAKYVGTRDGCGAGRQVGGRCGSAQRTPCNKLYIILS